MHELYRLETERSLLADQQLRHTGGYEDSLLEVDETFCSLIGFNRKRGGSHRCCGGRVGGRRGGAGCVGGVGVVYPAAMRASGGYRGWRVFRRGRR